MNTAHKVDITTAAIIDVREPIEFLLGHASGAINIPLRQIMSERERIKAFAKPIILYCRSGNRSQQAQLLLKASGIEEAYNGGSLGEVKEMLEKAA